VEGRYSVVPYRIAHLCSAAESARADMAIARQNVGRYKSLLEIRAVSQQEYDLAAAKAKQAEAVMLPRRGRSGKRPCSRRDSGRIGRSL